MFNKLAMENKSFSVTVIGEESSGKDFFLFGPLYTKLYHQEAQQSMYGYLERVLKVISNQVANINLGNRQARAELKMEYRHFFFDSDDSLFSDLPFNRVFSITTKDFYEILESYKSEKNFKSLNWCFQLRLVLAQTGEEIGTLSVTKFASP